MSSTPRKTLSRKSPVQKSNPPHHEGLNIPTVWIAIVLQIVGLLFFAGMGWARLAAAEHEIVKLSAKFERYDEVKERLVKLEVTLTSLAISVEKIAVRFETLGNRQAKQ